MPRVQSVDRAMVLLRAVATAAPEDSTAARLAETCDLDRSTAWRILHTLEAHDVVACDRDTGRWSIGVAVVDIAQSAGTDTIIALARPRLETPQPADRGDRGPGGLAPGRTDVRRRGGPAGHRRRDLAGRDGAAARHLDRQGAAGLRPGSPTTGERLERFTDTTLTRVAALEKQLAQVRRDGFATCRGEYEASAWGVSAPVLDSAGRLVAVLSIWGPGSRVTEERLDVLGPLVQKTAATLLSR